MREEIERQMQRPEEIFPQKDESMEKKETVWTYLLGLNKTEDKPAEKPGGQTQKLNLTSRLPRD